MVINPPGRVWIGARIDGAGGSPGHQLWQMPQGGIEGREEPGAAAKRELYEETSIRSITIVAQSADWLKYDLPGAMIGKALKGQYRGQTQKWFLARFDGDETEIDVH
ncbi:MAG: RNA pyrophosphohydrolase, partial [Hyphomicrobiales bacterium]